MQSHPSVALLGVASKPPLAWELPRLKRPIALNIATLLDGKDGTLRDTVVVSGMLAQSMLGLAPDLPLHPYRFTRYAEGQPLTGAYGTGAVS